MEDWFYEYIRRIRREIEELIAETEERMMRPLVDYERRCLLPLYELRDLGDEILIRVDLPGVEKAEDITVKGGENKIFIEAKMKRATSFEGLVTYARCNYQRYSLEITLPVSVDYKKASAVFRDGILEIRLPKKVKFFKVKVE